MQYIRFHGQKQKADGQAQAEPSESGIRARLRHLVQDSLRERLQNREPMTVGDRAGYGPYGLVVILEIVGERAHAQFEGSAAKTWASLEQLRRVAR